MTRQIHTCGLELGLYSLFSSFNVPHELKDTFICPITSATASFPMNDIPTMEIAIPIGRRLSQYGIGRDEFNEELLQNALKTRTPLGVYLTVTTPTDEPISGLEVGTLCLFKGYATGASEENGINGGSMHVSLTHWMSDLAIFPVLHRLSSPENSADVSSDGVFRERKGGDDSTKDKTNMSGTFWSPAKAYEDAILKGKTDLFTALKIGIRTTLEEGRNLKPEDPGYVNQKLYAQVSTAFDAMTSESLEFMDTVTTNTMLRWAISDALNKESRNDYFSVTIWQKLIQTMLPQFYAALVPLVDRGIVIPQPGIHMNPEKAMEIDVNTMLSLRRRTAYGKTLGGVILAGRPGAALPFGLEATKLKDIKYPDEPTQGVLKVANLPPWLEVYKERQGTHLAGATSKTLTAPNGGTEATTSAEEATTSSNNYASTYEKFAKAFVTSVYYAEACKGNGATLTTVLNLQICPGTVVKIPIPSDITYDDPHYCYGTVHTVQYTISPESAVSTFVLSNVRTEEQMDAMKTDGAVIYKEGWYNHKHKLYVKE